MENTGEPGCPSLPRGNEVFFYHWRPVESQDFHHHSAITRLPHPPTHSVCHSPKPGWHQRRQTRESELLFLPSSDKEPTRMDGHTHTHTHTHLLLPGGNKAACSPVYPGKQRQRRSAKLQD